MKLWKDLTAEEQAAWLAEQGQPAFRRQQIQEWLYPKQAIAFSEMSNLPAPLREKLAAEFQPFALTTVLERQATDGTRKFLFQLLDGETIETVLIPAPRRHTVCISTQVGCPVHCTFCASGQSGFVRNLTPAEIADQVIAANRALGERVNNIVVMGMGEPLLNLDNLLAALDAICDPERLGFGARHITISTSGIVPGIRRLAELGRQWNLALSLHAVTDPLRAKLIPATHRFPLAEILAACRDYREKCSRMVTLEYALIQGLNDSHADIRGLAEIARDLRAKVNLIPCNRTGAGKLAAPDRAAVQRIEEALLKAGVQVAVRREKGAEIMAACGQLRRLAPGGEPQRK
ncbi:MAG: 23S rRNA (adenine(2503)-C(2))-methyltransferase RlmN [Lentisphaeria bacterium]